MNRAILAQLLLGPATFVDLQRQLDIPSVPAHRRSRLLGKLRALVTAGQVRAPTVHAPWYRLRK